MPATGSLLSLAWKQLWAEKARLAVALAGVAFAVVLVSMQLGFRESMYASAVRIHKNLDFDLVMLNPSTPFIGYPESFTRRRLYQALGAEGVASVTPVYVRQGFWKNPWDYTSRSLLVIGVDPTHDVFKMSEVKESRSLLQQDDTVLFDSNSRPEFGPIAQSLHKGDRVSAEVNHRRLEVAALYDLGTSFGIDGSVITSDLNFLRIFPDRAAGHVELGLIHLSEGSSLSAVQKELVSRLDDDVLILDPEQFVSREIDYWSNTTPIGFVFGFGAVMGLIVGGVIVYQILFADVIEHSSEYATLKAIGYRNQDLINIVLSEAAILGVVGFLPGILLSIFLYDATSAATSLPLVMTPLTAAGILGLTLAMCFASGLVALRRVRSADPAEVFA
jgi:putative ABC transport system permease protein